MINRFTLLLSIIGMTLMVHLWIQKERNFDRGCWGVESGEVLSKDNSPCQDLALQEASHLLGMPTAGLGYFFFFAMAVLSFVRNISPQSIAAKCHHACDLAVGLALPVALYLVYVQVRSQSYCPLCLVSAGLIAALFAIQARQWRLGSFTAAAEAARGQELAYSCVIAFGGGGGLLALLLFVDRIGIRRLDQGSESLQVEAVVKQVLPRHLALAAPQKAAQPVVQTQIKLNEWIGSDTPYLGKPGGVPVILFIDPNCPHCKNSFSSFVRLSEKLKETATFYVLPRPLWDYSTLQVEALELAKGTGKYFDLWRIQFENQKPKGLEFEALSGIFTQLGLDTANLQKRLDSTGVGVFARRAKAQAAGINSTPTYFIDGTLVSVSATEENLTRLINQAALARTPNGKPAPALTANTPR